MSEHTKKNITFPMNQIGLYRPLLLNAAAAAVVAWYHHFEDMCVVTLHAKQARETQSSAYCRYVLLCAQHYGRVLQISSKNV